MAGYPTCACGCGRRRQRTHIMTWNCWSKVPKDIQDAVTAAYNPAAGIHQSPEWADAVQRAIASLRPAGTEPLL